MVVVDLGYWSQMCCRRGRAQAAVPAPLQGGLLPKPWRCSSPIPHPQGPWVVVQRKGWSCVAAAPGPGRESKLAQSTATAPLWLQGKLGTSGDKISLAAAQLRQEKLGTKYRN